MSTKQAKLWAIPDAECREFGLWTNPNRAIPDAERVAVVSVEADLEGGLDRAKVEAVAVELAKRWNDYGALIHRARAAVEFVAAYGDPGKCKGCGATVYWLRTTKARAVPFDADATNHFATCPERDRFKTNKG